MWQFWNLNILLEIKYSPCEEYNCLDQSYLIGNSTYTKIVTKKKDVMTIDVHTNLSRRLKIIFDKKLIGFRILI